jgi:hypothetical protein
VVTRAQLATSECSAATGLRDSIGADVVYRDTPALGAEVDVTGCWHLAQINSPPKAQQAYVSQQTLPQCGPLPEAFRSEVPKLTMDTRCSPWLPAGSRGKACILATWAAVVEECQAVCPL